MVRAIHLNYIRALGVLAVVACLWLWRNSIIEAEQAAKLSATTRLTRNAQEAIGNALDALKGASPDTAREWLRNLGSRLT